MCHFTNHYILSHPKDAIIVITVIIIIVVIIIIIVIIMIAVIIIFVLVIVIIHFILKSFSMRIIKQHRPLKHHEHQYCQHLSLSCSPAANVQQIISAQHIVLFLALPNVEQIVRDSTGATHHRCSLFGRGPFGRKDGQCVGF